MSGPVPTPEGDLRARIRSTLSGYSLAVAYEGDGPAGAVWEVVEPELARLRAEVDEWKRAAEAESQGRSAEVASLVRDLHAAQFDGSTSLPDRPLDTVWNWLLDLVRKDRSRLSGGNTPADAVLQIHKAINEPGSQVPRAADWVYEVQGKEIPGGEAFSHWSARAVAHLVRGWGSAVATPDGASKAGFEVGDLVRWTGNTGWFDGRITAATSADDRMHREAWDVTVTGLGSFYADEPARLGKIVHVEEDRLLLMSGAVATSDDTDRFVCSQHVWGTVPCPNCQPVAEHAIDLRRVPASPVGDTEAQQDAEDPDSPAMNAALFAVAMNRVRRDKGTRHNLSDVIREMDALRDAMDAAPREVVEHRAETREVLPGIWLTTCHGCDLAISGTHDEAQDAADEHIADTLQITKEG